MLCPHCHQEIGNTILFNANPAACNPAGAVPMILPNSTVCNPNPVSIGGAYVGEEAALNVHLTSCAAQPITTFIPIKP